MLSSTTLAAFASAAADAGGLRSGFSSVEGARGGTIGGSSGLHRYGTAYSRPSPTRIHVLCKKIICFSRTAPLSRSTLPTATRASAARTPAAAGCWPAPRGLAPPVGSTASSGRCPTSPPRHPASPALHAVSSRAGRPCPGNPPPCRRPTAPLRTCCSPQLVRNRSPLLSPFGPLFL